MTPRPALTEEIEEAARQFANEVLGSYEDSRLSFLAGANFALAALASQEQRRVDRHDEAIRLLREIASYEPLSDSDGGFINTWYEIETLLAKEPK